MSEVVDVKPEEVKEKVGPSPVLHEKCIMFNLFGSTGLTIYLEDFLSSLTPKGQELTKNLYVKYENGMMWRDDVLHYFQSLDQGDEDILYKKYSLFEWRIRHELDS